MYDTKHAGFLAAACGINRTVDTTITLNMADSSVKPLSTDDIVSYKITYASTAGKSFTPGTFVANQLELSLNLYSDAVKNIDFKNSAVESVIIEAGIQVDETMVYIPMGVFYPADDGTNKNNKGFESISAQDIPAVLYSQFNSGLLSFPCTVLDVLDYISDVVGVPIRIHKADFPNIDAELTETFALTSTYRDALRYIAEVLGAYVTMSRVGEIQIKKLSPTPVDLGFVLDDEYLFSVAVQESTVKPFQHISIKANKDDLGVTVETENKTGCEYDIIDNPLTYGHPEDFLEGLVEPTGFTEFHPSKISFQGRPDIDVGDAFEYTHKNVSYHFPVCIHTFEYNGGFKTTLESVGTDTLKVSSVDSGVKTQISALKQNMNNLVRDLTYTQSQIVKIDGNITEISTVLQTVEGITSQVSKLEGDLKKVSELTQTAEQLRIDIKTVVENLKNTNDTINHNQEVLLSYFDFMADGLVIGVSNSNIKLKLANNKIYFLKDDTQEVAYFSEGKLYVTDAHFLNSLVLGNFEFVPRTNGNLSLRYRNQEV